MNKKIIYHDVFVINILYLFNCAIDVNRWIIFITT